MQTIAFVSQKGGSGKSTIASSLAVAAHEMKEKVCVIDMDPQGSLMN
jgi:chromosome partitioning protein